MQIWHIFVFIVSWILESEQILSIGSRLNVVIYAIDRAKRKLDTHLVLSIDYYFQRLSSILETVSMCVCVFFVKYLLESFPGIFLWFLVRFIYMYTHTLHAAKKDVSTMKQFTEHEIKLGMQQQLNRRLTI